MGSAEGVAIDFSGRSGLLEPTPLWLRLSNGPYPYILRTTPQIRTLPPIGRLRLPPAPRYLFYSVRLAAPTTGRARHRERRRRQLRLSRRLGRPIASSALASSASGCRPRRASSLMPGSPLSAAVVRRGNERLLHRAGLRPRIRLTIRQCMQVLDEWPRHETIL